MLLSIFSFSKRLFHHRAQAELSYRGESRHDVSVKDAPDSRESGRPYPLSPTGGRFGIRSVDVLTGALR